MSSLSQISEQASLVITYCVGFQILQEATPICTLGHTHLFSSISFFSYIVNLAINLLQTAELIEEGAILLAIRPLRVGHKKVTQRFFKYEPAKQ